MQEFPEFGGVRHDCPEGCVAIREDLDLHRWIYHEKKTAALMCGCGFGDVIASRFREHLETAHKVTLSVEEVAARHFWHKLPEFTTVRRCRITKFGRCEFRTPYPNILRRYHACISDGEPSPYPRYDKFLDNLPRHMTPRFGPPTNDDAELEEGWEHTAKQRRAQRRSLSRSRRDMSRGSRRPRRRDTERTGRAEETRLPERRQSSPDARPRTSSRSKRDRSVDSGSDVSVAPVRVESSDFHLNVDDFPVAGHRHMEPQRGAPAKQPPSKKSRPSPPEPRREPEPEEPVRAKKPRKRRPKRKKGQRPTAAQMTEEAHRAQASETAPTSSRSARAEASGPRSDGELSDSEAEVDTETTRQVRAVAPVEQASVSEQSTAPGAQPDDPEDQRLRMELLATQLRQTTLQLAEAKQAVAEERRVNELARRQSQLEDALLASPQEARAEMDTSSPLTSTAAVEQRASSGSAPPAAEPRSAPKANEPPVVPENFDFGATDVRFQPGGELMYDENGQVVANPDWKPPEVLPPSALKPARKAKTPQERRQKSATRVSFAPKVAEPPKSGAKPKTPPVQKQQPLPRQSRRRDFEPDYELLSQLRLPRVYEGVSPYRTDYEELMVRHSEYFEETGLVLMSQRLRTHEARLRFCAEEVLYPGQYLLTNRRGRAEAYVSVTCGAWCRNTADVSPRWVQFNPLNYPVLIETLDVRDGQTRPRNTVCVSLAPKPGEYRLVQTPLDLGARPTTVFFIELPVVFGVAESVAYN